MRLLLAALLLITLLPAQAAREPRATRLFEQWKQADMDGDGELSRAEAAAMPALAANFDAIDRDRNGRITPDEVRAWRTAHRSRPRNTGPSGLSALLAKADANGDGLLSRSEIASSLPRMAPNFDRIDTDRNGLLSREEIDAWLARRRAARLRSAA